ncbi:MAG: ribonuclease P protein component [Deltaproteobacteria bacterium]
MKCHQCSSFPSESRIRQSSDFKEALHSGARLYSGNFTLIYRENSLGCPRLGLIVGKKSSKSAVKRNRAKRIIREVFRLNRSIFGSRDVLVMTRKNIESISFSKARQEIIGVCKSNFV